MQRPRDKARVVVVAVVRVALVALAAQAAQAAQAAVEVVPAAVVEVVGVVAALEAVLAEAPVPANGTTSPSAYRYSTSSTILTCRRQMEL